ncbi:MAG: NAD(P)H-dependent oxidoreductase [Candidatus ainarchaeum sp.]|nr:NAD(P)H-dependent oxidoreductase [Candidatus ainarchaeum sp.]
MTVHMKRIWVCRVCGYRYSGSRPPKECPQCSSPRAEFIPEKAKAPLAYDGKELDILLINGSTHAGHDTNILVSWAEAVLKKEKVRYRRVDLNSVNVEHCWCCYSNHDEACTFPCRNQGDEMSILHQMLLKSKGVLIASPINWNCMSARLKDFLDRTTCIQNLQITKGKAPCAGRPMAILVVGHEDGAFKTAHDIFHYFQQMGYVLTPFGITYITHGGQYNTVTDPAFVRNSKKVKQFTEATARNLVRAVRLDLPKRFGRIEISSE